MAIGTVSKEMMVFVCHVTLLDHVIRALYDLLVGSSSRYITILLSFMVIGSGSGNVMVLAGHVM